MNHLQTIRTFPLAHRGVLLSLAATVTVTLAQGPLDPPAGGPKPLMRTLEQVEPRIDLTNASSTLVSTSDPDFYYVIERSGSYVLSSNRNAGGLAIGPAVKPSFLKITADNVVLDLRGFQLGQGSKGLPGAVPANIAIEVTGENVRIQNGSIADFLVPVTGGDHVAVENLSVSECQSGIALGKSGRVVNTTVNGISGDFGIRVGESGAVLDSLVADITSSGALDGIEVGEGSTVSRCTVRGLASSASASSYGIRLGTGSSLSSSTVRSLTGGRSSGVDVGGGCTVTDCSVSGITASDGNAFGFEVNIFSGGVTIVNCGVQSVSAAHSTAVVAGFFGSGGARLADCSVRSCPVGFYLRSGVVAAGCHATQCDKGFELAGAAVHNSEASGCSEAGFLAVIRSTLQRCFATQNGSLNSGAGIWVSNTGNRVKNCTANGNYRDILVDGDENIIEDNSASGASSFGPVGFYITGVNNLVVRNASGGLQPYVIAPGNRVGPIVVDPVAATNPFSNFKE